MKKLVVILYFLIFEFLVSSNIYPFCGILSEELASNFKKVTLLRKSFKLYNFKCPFSTQGGGIVGEDLDEKKFLHSKVRFQVNECEKETGITGDSRNFLRSMSYDRIWKLIPETTPRIIKICPGCNQSRFYSSDFFRINAHHKLLDAWLIYKCVRCSYTYNFSIFRRKHVSKVNKELLNQLTINDSELAWKYAFSTKQFDSQVPVDWNITVNIEETFEESGKTDMIIDKDMAKVLAYSKYNLDIPIYKIIRKITNISRKNLNEYYENDQIKLYSLDGTSKDFSSSVRNGFVFVGNKSILMAPSI